MNRENEKISENVATEFNCYKIDIENEKLALTFSNYDSEAGRVEDKNKFEFTIEEYKTFFQNIIISTLNISNKIGRNILTEAMDELIQKSKGGDSENE